jgi:hypothetical protein
MILICGFKTSSTMQWGGADAEFATQQLRILADLETKLPAA